MGSDKGSIVRLDWRFPCRRRLLLRPLSGSPPLICRTMPHLPVALPDNDPPPPPTQMVAGISLSPFSFLTFSLRNHPGLSVPLLSLHFLTSSASISPSLSLSKVQFLTGEMVAGISVPLHQEHHRLTFDLLSLHSQTAQRTASIPPVFLLTFSL